MIGKTQEGSICNEAWRDPINGIYEVSLIFDFSLCGFESLILAVLETTYIIEEGARITLLLGPLLSTSTYSQNYLPRR